MPFVKKANGEENSFLCVNQRRRKNWMMSKDFIHIMQMRKKAQKHVLEVFVSCTLLISFENRYCHDTQISELY